MATKTSSKKAAPKKPTANKNASTPATTKAAPEKTKHNKTALAVIGGIIIFFLLIFAFKNFFIAATVNGEPISRLEIIKTLEEQGGQQTLESVVTKTLILQEAKNKNIQLSQEDMDGEIKKIEDSLKGQNTTLDDALAAQGMTRNDLNEDIRLQLLVQKLVEERINVTDEEVNKYVEENNDFFLETLSEEERIEQAREQLSQQQIQLQTQVLIKDLQDNSNTIYYVTY